MRPSRRTRLPGSRRRSSGTAEDPEQLSLRQGTRCRFVRHCPSPGLPDLPFQRREEARRRVVPRRFRQDRRGQRKLGTACAGESGERRALSRHWRNDSVNGRNHSVDRRKDGVHDVHDRLHNGRSFVRNRSQAYGVTTSLTVGTSSPTASSTVPVTGVTVESTTVPRVPGETTSLTTGRVLTTLSAEATTCSTTGVTAGTGTATRVGTAGLMAAGKGRSGTGTLTVGGVDFGDTTPLTAAPLLFTAPVVADSVLSSCAETLPPADDTVEVTEDVSSPKSEPELTVSALAALVESATQAAAPAPAIMTERRIRAARGNACMAFISTPPR